MTKLLQPCGVLRQIEPFISSSGSQIPMGEIGNQISNCLDGKGMDGSGNQEHKSENSTSLNIRQGSMEGCGCPSQRRPLHMIF